MIKTGIDDWVIEVGTDCYVLGRMVSVKDSKTGASKEILQPHSNHSSVSRALNDLYAQMSRDLVRERDYSPAEAIHAISELRSRFGDLSRLM